MAVAGTLKQRIAIAAIGQYLDGTSVEQIVPAALGLAELTFRRQLHRLSLYVVDRDGLVYDNFHVADIRADLGESLLFSSQAVAQERQARSLLLATAEGEGRSIEFKEWMPTKTADKKGKELLQTAVAFANASG